MDYWLEFVGALDTPEGLCSDLGIVYTWKSFLITFDPKFSTVLSYLLPVSLTEGSYNWESVNLLSGRAE